MALRLTRYAQCARWANFELGNGGKAYLMQGWFMQRLCLGPLTTRTVPNRQLRLVKVGLTVGKEVNSFVIEN